MSLTVEKCLQAWSNSLRQMNSKADIVFFGDSLTYHGDFSSVFPDKVVCNLGLRGDTIQGMIERVEQVKKLEPKVVYLMAGINDVSTCTPSQFEVRYDMLIQKILCSIKNVVLIIQSMLPVNNNDFSIYSRNECIKLCNEKIILEANKYGLQYIDLFSVFEQEGSLPKEFTIDGIHLNSKAYKKWFLYL